MKKKVHTRPPKRKLWFKAKQYGWGWYPVCWQGWSVLLLYVLDVLVLFYLADNLSHSESDTFTLTLPYLVILTVILVAVSFLNGERPQWRWGKKLQK